MDQTRTSTRAIVALTLAVVALPAISCFGCGGVVLGVAAILVGVTAQRQIQESGGAEGGKGLAQAGIIIGAIAALLGLLFGIGILVIPGLTYMGPEIQELFEDLVRQLQAG